MELFIPSLLVFGASSYNFFKYFTYSEPTVFFLWMGLILLLISLMMFSDERMNLRHSKVKELI